MIAILCAHLCKVNKIITNFAKNNNEMIVERDFAGFAFPFAAGITAVMILDFHLWTAFHIPAAASILMSAVSVLLLAHPAHRTWDRHLVTALIIIAALGCGILTGTTHRLISVSSYHGETFVPQWISGLGDKLGEIIKALPFKDSGTAGIINALITGDRTGIPPEVTYAFRNSGASHILSLSGLHLGIIYGFLNFIFKILGNSRNAVRSRAVLTILACGLYTAATGAGASITRAFLFILIRETARVTGRHADTAGVLMTALVIQLVLSPGDVVNAGFQLSYAAMAGIAFIFPRLKGLWPEVRGGLMKWMWNSAAMSIACQITTGPIAYLYFGTFPVHFLLTNLIAVPLTGIIIPLSLLNVVGICPDTLIPATEFLMECMRDSLEIIASM